MGQTATKYASVACAVAAAAASGALIYHRFFKWGLTRGKAVMISNLKSI